MLLQVILSGVVTGSLYALIALGFVLLFKATEVVNFAHGEVVMIGAYFGLLYYVELHLPYYLCFPLALVSAFFVGIVINLTVCQPLIRAQHLSVIIATFALSFLIRSVIRLIWGSQYYSFVSPFRDAHYNLGGLVVGSQHFWITVISFLIMAIFYLVFNYTKAGKAMFATSQNREAASLMGVNIKAVFSLVWGISCALGAASGILLAPIIAVSPYMGGIAIKAFSAAVLGGFNSLPGAVLGGILIGIIENLCSIYISSAYKDILAFLILILVLIVKPTGLLGTEEIKRT